MLGLSKLLTQPLRANPTTTTKEKITMETEKVSCNHATIHDLFGVPGKIEAREAAQLRAEAQEQKKAIDEALKRAKGDMTVLLRDIKD